MCIRDRVKGVGDLFSKAVRGKVTGESAIKPEYTGTGILVTEPTYKHLLLVNLEDWNGSIVLDDGLFLACDSKLTHKAVMRSNFSSAVAGNEGLFNLGITGKGALCLESPVPLEELVEITLQDDVLKIDGNMAIAWSGSLDFTVERSGKMCIRDRVHAENVFVLPNNSNIILAAQQAESVCDEENVIVLPSKSIPQGYAACINFNPEVDVDVYKRQGLCSHRHYLIICYPGTD